MKGLSDERVFSDAHRMKHIFAVLRHAAVSSTSGGVDPQTIECVAAMGESIAEELESYASAPRSGAKSQ